MTATVPIHPTVAPASPTGPLTVPVAIIRAAGARHRVARAEGTITLPGWVLLAAAAFFFAAIGIAVLAWVPVASPLLIVISIIGLAAAYTPDVLAALQAR